ncbi:uncharacterized protein LOC132791246 isoform X2 [Drosophila nasuta]|uniref:uncharacterized protein LOC132791246 isoform X2 n=1 Tax=Drosophila nasuta TaxID=42062 RepID=UPI00295F3010|nr:uncharacterized protein LOC132791246 isoform X2 [Drosophila nasuta]
MRKRDIIRLWNQVVDQTGIDKYTDTQWQEIYEEFLNSMYDYNEPYISVQSVEKLVDELEENMEISKSLNTSSDIDDEPLSALKNRLEDKIKVEPITTLRRSTRRCVVDNNNFNQQLADIKFKSEQLQTHLKTEMAKHKDDDLLMLGTSPKQEKAQTKKSTNNNATKKKRINSENLTEQNEATAKRMRTQTKLTIEKGDHKIDKNEKQQVPGKSNLDKLKSKPPRIRRAKSKIMAPTAHMPPSAINLTRGPTMNNTSSAEEAVTLEVVEAENLSSLMIVTERDSEKKEPVNVDKNAEQENVDFNQLLANDESLDVDIINVTEDDEPFQGFDEKTKIEIYRDLANSTQYLDNLAIELADEIHSELDSILHNDRSLCDQNAVLQNDPKLTKESIDLLEEIADLSLTNDLFMSSEAATNSLATNFNLLEQNTMFEDELNLTQESIEILQNNIHSMEISRTMLQNDLYLSTETGSENASIEHDLNLTNLATDAQNSTFLYQYASISQGNLNSLVPRAILQSDRSSATGSSTDTALESIAVTHEDDQNLTNQNSLVLKKQILVQESSCCQMDTEPIENAVVTQNTDLNLISQGPDNIALVEQDNLKTSIQQNKNNDKTPLEQDALLQDELNFEIDSDDVLSLITSWDGGMDDIDERNSIVNEMDWNESDIAASIVDSMSPLTALTTTAVSPEATAHPATNAVETNISLNDLRSFRIPKKTNNPKLQLETLQEPHKQALVNGEQQQRESGKARQQPANNIEHKQQHRVVNGRQQQKESLVNDNRQLPRCNAQKEPFFNGNPQQPTIANLQRQKSLKQETQLCRPIRAAVPDAVPIFAPPYQRSEQPAASSSVSSTFNIYRGMGRNSAAFDIKCWKYLDGYCANPNCNHQLSEIGDVRRRLNSMTNKQLIDCYNFMLRHRLLFQKYFALFATIFGSRQMRNYMLRMINDCCLYMELCAPFIVDIYETLLRFHMSPEVTVAHLMKYLWQPNALLQYPLLINELLKILAIEYWHNYMPQLEELFDTLEFPIPLEFGRRIAEFAVTQKNEMLKINVCQLVLYTPIGRSYSTATTVAEILRNDSAGQPNPQLQTLLLAIRNLIQLCHQQQHQIHSQHHQYPQQQQQPYSPNSIEHQSFRHNQQQQRPQHSRYQQQQHFKRHQELRPRTKSWVDKP